MTYGVQGNTDSFFDYFNVQETLEDAAEIKQNDELLDISLSEAIEKVIQSNTAIPAIEEGLDHVFSALQSCINTITLKKVVDVIERFLEVTKDVTLSVHCKQLMLSNFMELNFKLQESLTKSQIEQYPNHKEWQEYFSSLNHLFNVQACEWENMCFCYIEHQTQIPLYSFNLFTSQLDALTFLVVAGREDVVWQDYEMYYDQLMQKYLDLFLGSEFGDRAINQYALVENGRELTVSMAMVIKKYLENPSIPVCKAFGFVYTLIFNRTMSPISYAVIVKSMITKFSHTKVYSILEYKKLLSLFTSPVDKKGREEMWKILQDEISQVITRRFKFDCNTDTFMEVQRIKDLDKFLACKNEMQKEIDLWHFFEKIDSNVKGNSNNFIRYIASCLSAHLNSSSPEQTCKLLAVLEKFVQGRKIGDLAQKCILSAVLGGIELERKRSEGKSDLIVEFSENRQLINSDYLPLINEYAGKLLSEITQECQLPYPMIQTISRLLNLKESEIMLRIAPGIVKLFSYKLPAAKVFKGVWGSHELNSEEIITIKDVIQSSKLSQATFTLKLYFMAFDLTGKLISNLTEQILARALDKKKLSYDEMNKILQMLLELAVGGEKDNLIKAFGPKIIQLLKHKFSLWSLIRINGSTNSKFTLTHYYNLFSMYMQVINRYGIDKDKILPEIHKNWFLEAVIGLKKIKRFGFKELEEKKFLLVRRQIPASELVLLELELSKIKEQLLKVVVNSFDDHDTHSKRYKKLTSFINRGYYEKPMHDESCLTFEDGKLTLNLITHSK